MAGLEGIVIALFTDYGWDGPYVGQLRAALYQAGIGDRPIVDLMHDAPAYDPRAAGFLLAALVPRLPPDCVVVAVVDPGVGGGRRGAVVKADGRWLVGPDNGLFDPLARGARQLGWWDIRWPEEGVSATFHGRDVFAPVAAAVARAQPVPGEQVVAESRLQADGSEDLAEVVYVDGFGNAMTGVRAAGLAAEQTLEVNGRVLRRARTFSDLGRGEAFWYANSIGLVEVAVNSGSAAQSMGLAVGTRVSLPNV